VARLAYTLRIKSLLLLFFRKEDLPSYPGREKQSVQTQTTKAAPDAATARRQPAPPLTPIMVTAPGRSGTTLLMGLLSRSPDIVAAELPPYEVRLIAYHASVFTTLTAPADFERSHHPDRLEGDGFKVGSNPFNSPNYPVFKDEALRKEYFDRFVLGRISRCARDLINEYYGRLAQDCGKSQARFFAEKSNNMHRPTRMFARRAFGDIRELMIVRDPRDILCSQVVYFGNAHDKAFTHIAGAVRHFLVVRGENRPDVHMLRYEDLVQGNMACLGAMSDFLGTPIAPDPGERGAAVFRKHATSATPEASIGRWRTDLPEALKARCATEWGEFLGVFGYGKT
jgi:hypothetical protein